MDTAVNRISQFLLVHLGACLALGGAPALASDFGDALGLATPGSVDVWFQVVANGSAPERVAAMKMLKAALQSDDGQQNECVMAYPYEAEDNGGAQLRLTPNRRHCAVLLDAIPNLIEALKDESNREAWWILICLQPHCPPANHELWVKWWNEKGFSDFRRMAKAP
jgi:hypothetical protein